MSPTLTIRKSTDEERRAKSPPIVGGGPRVRVPKYVVVTIECPDRIATVFGLPQGGDTREKALFWALRMASKNGLDFARPAGWERVRGELPA